MIAHAYMQHSNKIEQIWKNNGTELSCDGGKPTVPTKSPRITVMNKRIPNHQ